MNNTNGAVNWEQIRFFVEVVKAGSVAQAAAGIGVSHATVLRSISRLEQDLGIKLFDRLQSGYRITPQGEELLPSALAMAEHVETLVRRAAGKNPAPEGLLRLQVPDSSLIDLGPLIADFRALYPRIFVQTEQLPDELMARSEVDVALALTNAPPDDLVGRQIAKVEFAYYASSAYLGDTKRAKSLELDDCDWVVWGGAVAPADGISASAQEGLLRRFSKRPNIALRVSSHSDALAAVRAGVGISLLRKPQDELEEVPVRTGVRSIGLWILTHQELQRSGRIQAFMDSAIERYLAA